MLERPWVGIEGTEEALRNLWKTLKSPKWPWGRHWEYWWGSCERLWSWHWGYVGSPERPCSVQKLNNQIYVHANSTFYMCWYRIHVYLIYVSWYPHYFIIWYCIIMIYIIVFVKKKSTRITLFASFLVGCLSFFASIISIGYYVWYL